MGKAFKPYFTWAVVLLVCGISLYNHSQAEPFYGLKNPSSLSLAFNPQSPLATYALPWISSAFLHQRFEHLLLNLIIFVVLSYLLEKKLGPKVSLCLFISSHLMTLLGLILLSTTNLIQASIYMGISHINFAFFAIVGIHNKNKFLFTCALVVISYSLLTKQNTNQDLSHLLGFASGIISYYSLKKIKVISSLTS